MTEMSYVAAREMKIGFRNPWAYSFTALFALFMLSLLIINAQGYVKGYSGSSSTMLNLALYLLPLMALMLGSFSLTGEKEEGNWELLSTYPLGTWAFLTGKFAGLSIVLLAIVAFGFGLSGAAGSLFGGGFDFATYGQLLVFSICLSLLFLGVAMLIGTIAHNRWQALTIGVGIWFFAIIAWPSILIAMLGMMPYPWIKPSLTFLTLLNPAELTRLFTVVKLGGGSTLGPEYYNWMLWIRSPWGTPAFLGVLVIWIGLALTVAYRLWERERRRG
ncbi:ABC transporter permease subunit [Paenibacillus sp. UMB4589-SE434]|uniref:ABC transporter permease n=1 Tax=Paenibacillus sp. UMB4589-SE434 TaxID=3046314 RepID=UPI00254BC685|nr:ABC transporter permease subunit [Paenibacillus sp. UMB4589-SE434]MDK8180242.1 ABC transporter permease subunit [Paenibacillus sp. UMB4589-SE434]